MQLTASKKTQLHSLVLLMVAFCVPFSAFAQSPASTKVTHVLATLTVKEGVQREAIMKVMPGEVRSTVQLYLDGRIQQWFARGDGKGVVFLLDCKTVEEAKAILETLPLIKENFASFEYMPLGPLTPLRLLIAPPPAAK
jgi:hypothetical protein